MSVNLYGLDDVEQEPGATLSESDSGIVSYAETFIGRKRDIENTFFQLTRRVSTHPQYPGLALETKVAREGEGNMSVLELLWEGTNTTGDDPDNPEALPEPQYYLDKQPSEEPIDSHPNFSAFGIAANGAKFDDDGIFLGFSSTGAFADNPYGGLSKYLVGGRTLTRVSVYNNVPASVKNTPIPSIETPPSPPFGLPSIAGRDWLKIDGSISQRGSAFEVREAWRESGDGGWLASVYS